MKWDISAPQGHLKHKYRTAPAFAKKLYIQQALLHSKMNKLFLQTTRNINVQKIIVPNKLVPPWWFSLAHIFNDHWIEDVCIVRKKKGVWLLCTFTKRRFHVNIQFLYVVPPQKHKPIIQYLFNFKRNLYQWRIPWHYISKFFYSRWWYTKMLQEYYVEQCPLSASDNGQSQK